MNRWQDLKICTPIPHQAQGGMYIFGIYSARVSKCANDVQSASRQKLFGRISQVGIRQPAKSAIEMIAASHQLNFETP